MVFNQITYFQILGKPLIMYIGIITLLALLFTASISIASKKGIRWVPFEWHPRMARLTIALAIIHGLMGLLAYF